MPFTISHFQEILEKFVSENFDKEGTELEMIVPNDWQEKPDFIEKIQDDGLKKLAIEMNRIWKNLTRKISKDKLEIETKSSMIYLEHPFVIPGGRFREGQQKINIFKRYIRIIFGKYIFFKCLFREPHFQGSLLLGLLLDCEGTPSL